MSDVMIDVPARPVNRRSFLRGSALFAGAIGLGFAPMASAQGQGQQPPTQDPQQGQQGQDKKPTPPSSDPENKIDAQGREYRDCPQCGSHMYREGRTWTCENCGYSYVE